MPKLYFVIFIVIALSVYGGMHWFVYQRIASGLLLTAGQRLALKLFMVAGALSFILAEFVSRQKPIFPLRYHRLRSGWGSSPSPWLFSCWKPWRRFCSRAAAAFWS